MKYVNPHDWFVLAVALGRDKSKYVNQIAYQKKMINFDFFEISKMDVDLVEFLNRKPCIGPCDQPNNIQNKKDGLI